MNPETRKSTGAGIAPVGRDRGTRAPYGGADADPSTAAPADLATTGVAGSRRSAGLAWGP
ncbi:hypothetical protein GCM10009818_35690 [Nakamurella flavida]